MVANAFEHLKPRPRTTQEAAGVEGVEGARHGTGTFYMCNDDHYVGLKRRHNMNITIKINNYVDLYLNNKISINMNINIKFSSEINIGINLNTVGTPT